MYMSHVRCLVKCMRLIDGAYKTLCLIVCKAKFLMNMEDEVHIPARDHGKRRAGGDDAMKELVNKKTGCLLYWEKSLDKQAQAYLEALRENGAVVNTAITIACTKGVVMVACWSVMGGAHTCTCNIRPSTGQNTSWSGSAWSL